MTVQQHIKARLKAGGLSNRQAMAVIWIARAVQDVAPVGRWWSRDVDQAAAWLPELSSRFERLAETYRNTFLSTTTSPQAES